MKIAVTGKGGVGKTTVSAVQAATDEIRQIKETFDAMLM